jgi:C1A family cysteine protease
VAAVQWAFAATGAIEGSWQIAGKTHRIVSLSEQQLVDCSSSNLGCNGGNPRVAFSYVIGKGGLDGEADYPYRSTRDHGVQLTCDPAREARHEARIASCQFVSENDEISLQQAVLGQPVAVAINADDSLQHYSGGVFSSNSCGQDPPNHAVLIIGFGSDPNPYWKIKNSW